MWRVIDISGEGNYLHVKNRNIHVEKDGNRIESIAFADVNSIVVHGRHNVFSEEFLSMCIENSIPVIFCNNKHMPSGMLLQWYQHSDSALRLACQLSVSQPKRKQAWQRIIKAKISNQAVLLDRAGQYTASAALLSLRKRVLSGDSGNVEAQAARLYFDSLFGMDFIRHENDSLNAFLDYGYTIIRSLVARAVVGAGLCPSVSIFHSNRRNPFALIDDLMEPLRAFADDKVIEICKTEAIDHGLGPSAKRTLISLVSHPVEIKGIACELSYATGVYVHSYYQFLSGESDSIDYPKFEGYGKCL